uniref:Uncharacterized protein n=1 Tax=Cacopsylla melanoneura TaxID=428564 RepID=A0A8D8Z6U3_9HEMI
MCRDEDRPGGPHQTHVDINKNEDYIPRITLALLALHIDDETVSDYVREDKPTFMILYTLTLPTYICTLYYYCIFSYLNGSINMVYSFTHSFIPIITLALLLLYI